MLRYGGLACSVATGCRIRQGWRDSQIVPRLGRRSRPSLAGARHARRAETLGACLRSNRSWYHPVRTTYGRDANPYREDRYRRGNRRHQRQARNPLDQRWRAGAVESARQTLTSRWRSALRADAAERAAPATYTWPRLR